jgi:microcystin-dependent protein
MNEGTIGEIRLFAGSYTPEHWELCDGKTILIRENPALFSILGTQYGGDGEMTFQLPNLAPLKESDGGETPIRYIICLDGNYPRRA